MRRTLATVLCSALLISGAVVIGGAPPAKSGPVATSNETYTPLGRVFPDPQGCGAGTGPQSPWAKGTACAVDFIQYQEMVDGMKYMESLLPRYVNFYTLHRD